MADKNYQILIEIRSQLAGLQAAERQMQNLRREAQGVTAAMAGFTGGLAGGAIAQFTSSLAQLPAAISSLVGAFTAVIGQGVRFNATLETAQLGIAATIKQFDQTGKIKNFDDAMVASARTIDLLKQKAVESPATFEQLVKAFQGISAAASSANIPLKRQVDLVVLMSQALSGMGIASEQIIQESRALLSGNITEDAIAAKQLQITKAQIDDAKARGQLFEFLTAKLAAYGEAGVRSQQTFNTALSNMADGLQLLKAEAAQPIFQQLTDELLAFNKAIASVEARAAARTVGDEMSILLKIASETAREFVGLAQAQERQSVTGKVLAATLTQLIDAFTGVGTASLVSGAISSPLSANIERIKTEEFQKQVDALYAQAAASKTAEQIAATRGAAEKFIEETNKRITEGYFKDAQYVREIAGIIGFDLVEHTKAWADTTATVVQNLEAAAAAAKKAIAASAATEDVETEIALKNAEASGNKAEALRIRVESLRSTVFNRLVAEGKSEDEAWISPKDERTQSSGPPNGRKETRPQRKKARPQRVKSETSCVAFNRALRR